MDGRIKIRAQTPVTVAEWLRLISDFRRSTAFACLLVAGLPLARSYGVQSCGSCHKAPWRSKNSVTPLNDPVQGSSCHPHFDMVAHVK